MFKRLIQWICRLFGIEQVKNTDQSCYWHIISYSPARPLLFQKMKSGIADFTIIPGNAWKFGDYAEARDMLDELQKQTSYDFYVEKVLIL